jgi:methionyl-tRNA formyltransferase
MRVAFFGTPEFAVPSLVEIVGHGHDVVAVYTQPPRPAGRGKHERRSAVHEAAAGFGLSVLTPHTLKSDREAEHFAGLEADVGVVVAYGKILPPALLRAPVHGCWNLHASLLPRWRGAAPVARALMAGDAQTGVMVMQMEEGLDTGPIAMSERVVIGPDATAGDLTDHLARLGADLMGRALAALERGGLDLAVQSGEGATYAKKIDKAEARIDWSAPGSQVHNHIRGLAPWPGAWFEAVIGGKPERIKVLRSTLADGSGAPGTIIADDLTIACGEGAVRLVEVQRAGRKPVPAVEFVRGLHAPLTKLG